MTRLPWPARWVVRLVVPNDRREDVTGDLHLVHDRRRTRLGTGRAWITTVVEAAVVASAFVLYRWRARQPGRSAWFSWPEVRIAARRMKRQPVLTTTAVVALAVGIGLATVGFTFLDTMVYGRLPYPDGDRFVRITAYREPMGERVPVGLDRYRVFAARADRLTHLGAIDGARFNVAFGNDGSDVELLTGAWITPASFAVLPTVPVLGRLLTPSDGAPSAAPVVVLRQSLWQRRFGGRPEALGATLRIAGVDRTIVGVLPDDFGFPNAGEVWLPLTLASIDGVASSRNSAVGLFGVLAPDATTAEAQEQLTTLSAGVGTERRDADEVRIVVRGFTAPPEGVDAMMVAFVVVLVTVLLVIAANVANLILVRTTARSHEMAIRAALGAGRLRLVRQVAVEVLLMGAVAAVLGTAGAGPLLRYIGQSVEDLPFWIVIEPGLATVGFVVALTLLATVVAGVIPALRTTRGDPAAALRTAGPGAMTAIGRAGKAMITVEVTLSVALLSVAIIMARGLDALVHPALGLPERQILVAWANLAPSPDSNARHSTRLRAIIQAVSRVEGVRAVGAGSTVPGLSPAPLPIEIEGVDGESNDPLPAPVAEVSPEFFAPYGELRTTGRLIRQADLLPGAQPVAIVTEPFAEKFLGARSPIGRRLRVATGHGEEEAPWREIVGVVPDLGLSVGDPELAAGVYVPGDTLEGFYLAIRAVGDPMRLLGPVRDAATKADPNLWLRHGTLLEDVGGENVTFLAATSGSLTTVGLVALLLSLAGVYAIMSLAVTSRTREIGLRVALGATRGQVLAHIFASAVWYLGLGAVSGAGLGALLLQARGIFTFRLEAPGPWIFGSVVGLVAVAGLVACWVPARRVLDIRPMEALKSE